MRNIHINRCLGYNNNQENKMDIEHKDEAQVVLGPFTGGTGGTKIKQKSKRSGYSN